ncbi:MAG TPA: flagellar M-ring protein FliF C-terminal domain-containing protein [Fimbriimonadaceae bacterium]|jgi:flagellar biosynthesis/type III secretory pathway M-ring protein FliF/YscJ
MAALLLKLRTWWETADRTQKAVTIFGSVFLVLLLGGTFYFASKPHMSLAFSGLDSAEVGTVTDEITKLGVPVDYDVNGNVQVPSDKVAMVRAKLAEAGKLPSPGHMGDDLTKIGVINSPNVEKERLKSIQENQIAEAIENIKGVTKAEVQLNLGDKSAFEDETKPATASVQVTLSPDQMINSDQGHVIAMLVANSVTGLSPDKVFVSDNAGHTLYDGSTAGSEGGVATQKLQQEMAEAKRREHDLQQKLDAAFGPGNTLVTVNLELDYDKKTTHSDVHPKSNAQPEVENLTSETMNGEPPMAGGVGGLKANITPTTPAPAGPDKKYVATTTQNQRPIDEVVTDRDSALGSLKSMSVTALVKKTKLGADGKPDPTDQPDLRKQSVEDYLIGYLKPFQSDPLRQSAFAETTVLTDFDTTAATATAAAQKAEESRNKFQQIISLLPIGALLFVGFLVAKAIGKAAKPQLMAALPGGGMMPLEAGNPLHEAEVHYDENGEAIPHALEEPGPQPIEEIGTIHEKLNLPLEQLKRMSDDKAENVAMLIKTWLLEDHK